MKTSEQIDKLAEALAAAQGAIKAATKDAENPFFKSSYATLDSVWTACREPLSKHGLSVIQVPLTDADGLHLVTRLCHSSGQWIEGDLSIKPSKDDLQGIGSAITYARRYMLGAMVGVATDADDDGNDASTKKPQSKQPPQANQQPPKQKATVQSGADLLKVVNSVDQVNNYFKNVTHLKNAVAKGLGIDGYDWPDPKDVDGWRAAYSAAKDYAISAIEIDQTVNQQEPLFAAEEKKANGAYAN